MNKFRRARLECGLTQKELADILGVSVVSVCKWEQGKSFPTPRRIRKVSDVLHVPVDKLLNELEGGSSDGAAS